MAQAAGNGGESFTMRPIGYVRGTEEKGYLEILEPFRPALKQLDQFSHVIVVWWAHGHDNEEHRNIMQCEPPYADGRVTGIFACRAEYRPNPVAITTCKITGVDEEKGIVRVGYIDAFDGTPIVDLKAYFPISDRAREATIPPWLSHWPEWIEDAHLLEW